MKFVTVWTLLLSSFLPSILLQGLAHEHVFGVPKYCWPRDILSILGGIVVAVSFLNNDDHI